MIQPWRDRLDWTGERSPSNADRLKAAEAEIRDLRDVLKRTDHKLESAKARAVYWRKLAYAHSAELKKERKANERWRKGQLTAPVQREPRRVEQPVGRDIQTQWAGASSPFNFKG